VLPLGSISNVHGIMSNGHHMYDAAVDRNNIFVCVNRQTSEGTSYMSNLCRGRRSVVNGGASALPADHATRAILPSTGNSTELNPGV
jgi:hypothetical protein